ncbi:MAG: class I SAM-dependent methyltransferase [Gammaproteobacteria bacterium]|nr:class I SAM-dependent methyltransferase [Gammaproteobacteria bacterium]
MLASNEQGYECRLCDGSLSHRFDLKILGTHDVRYFECTDCGSLQTEPPHWLDEAYGNTNLSNLDTGTAQRNIHNLAACFAISKLFRLRNAIDFGGGDGLLCRMLRDYEINCFVKDKFATPTYAQGFTEEDFDTPDLLIGFELLEHFSNPKSDVKDLFEYRPGALLLSTEIYTNEGKDWWYLLPESGQHVFFYSRKALEQIADKYNYSLVFSGGFILFVRSASALRKALARILLNRYICRLIRGLVVLLPARGVWKDHAIQVEKSKRAQQQV